MHEHGDRRFRGDMTRLRSAERVMRLEVERAVSLTLEDLDAKTVLDIGTGTGVFAEEFANRGVQVSGIDANPHYLEEARKHVPEGSFRVGTAESLPYSDGRFDIVFLGHVLHEADDLLGALGEARRVATQRVAIVEWAYIEEEEGPPFAHRLKPEVVVALAREARFINVERIRLSHMDFYRMEP